VYGRDQNIALVLDENGNVNHRYLFGNGVDQIEADESNGTVLWALTDHLGSVRDVVDDSGTVLNHIVYDAFGGVTSQTDESVVFKYGYTARELDAESGLQYNRARYLDSFTGKFISEDPISFQSGDSNLYRYVFNSPIGYSDPSGLFLEAGVSAAEAGAKAIGSGSGLLSGLALIGRFVAPVAAFATTFFAFTQSTADDDTLLTPAQDERLRSPRNQVAPKFKYLAPDPSSCEDKDNDRKKCYTGQLPMHQGGNATSGAGQSTYVTGSSGDFIIFAKDGSSAFFDGLVTTRGELFRRFNVSTQRHVAEVKIVTGSVKKPFLRSIDLNTFTAEGFADLRVAQQCNYSYSFVVSDDSFAKDLQQRFGSAIPVYTIPE
jgi:RHS repeat-associated protein